MSHNLTDRQRKALVFLVEKERAGDINETFFFLLGDDIVKAILGIKEALPETITIHVLEALATARMVILKRDMMGGSVTFTQLAYDAVDAGFAEPEDEFNWKRLQAFLTECFGAQELRTLATRLGIDHEDIGGEAKPDYARELVSYMKRRGRLWEMVRVALTLK